MSADPFRNPHRLAPRPPLLAPHEVRPSVLGSGVALVVVGAALLAQQLGLVRLGVTGVLVLLAVASAVTLGGIALGWAGRAATDGGG